MTTKNQEALSRCPFCPDGGGPKVSQYECPNSCNIRATVMCEKCGINGPERVASNELGRPYPDADKRAIRAWNTRASTDRQQEAERLLGVALEAFRQIIHKVGMEGPAYPLADEQFWAIKSFMESKND